MHNNSNVSIRLVVNPYLDNNYESYFKKVLELDRKCFYGDEPVALEGAFWWLGYNDMGKAVAFCGLRPCQTEVNDGYGYFIRAGVLRPYRGKGIQKRMIKARLRMAKKVGLKTCVTYVKGFNHASANSLIKCGFKLYSPQTKWGGKSALYFQKCLENV